MSYYTKYVKNYQKTPKGKFIIQRASAKRRQIEWELTFDEWWDIWQKSGKWELRGNQANLYCMARKGDQGGYVKGNVIIKLLKENSREIKKNIIEKESGPSLSDYWFTPPISSFEGGWKEKVY